MSLISELKNAKSPVATFFKEHFPNTGRLVRQTNRSLSGAETIGRDTPFKPAAWALLGTAIDYRLRYYFPKTDHRSLVAFQGANLVTGEWQWPGHNGTLLSLSPELVEEFFESLDVCLDRIQPAGRRLQPDEEGMLCRYCVTLALFDQVFRAGASPNSLLFSSNLSSTRDMLSLAPSEWIGDLRAQSWLFYDSLGSRLSEPCTLNPTFVGSGAIGGADADLIRGGCLIDCKATINPSISRQWLCQLLGYAFLDLVDEYRLTRVGVYLSRQGALMTWGLEDLMAAIGTGAPSQLADMRSRFAETLTELK